MKKIIKILLSSLLIALFAFTASGHLNGDIPVYAAKTSVAYPKSSLKSGIYYLKEITKIKLTTTTEGADIYYCINDGKYQLYSKPIALTQNTQIKTYAVKDGVKSKVILYNYRFKPKFKVSHKSGTYTSAQVFTIKSSTSDVKYYYTIDGDEPTEFSTPYPSSGIVIDESCTLRILAKKKNWREVYLSFDFKINDNYDGTSKVVNFAADYTQKYGYKIISEEQKVIYEHFYDMALSFTREKTFKNSKFKAEDVSAAYWAFDHDNGQFYWLGHGYGYKKGSGGHIDTLILDFSRTKEQTAQIAKEFDKSAAEIINAAASYSNTFERIKFLHDVIINMTNYRKATYQYEYLYEADGPIVHGMALCEGYSKAFMYLCQSVGIECICVSSDDHMWNMVKIKNKWYHIDITNDIDFSGDCIYDYFLVSTDTMLKEHDILVFYPLPDSIADYNHDL